MMREPPQQHGPLLSSGDSSPGRFVEGKWVGPLDWCTQHGAAILQWSVGFPTYVWNARDESGQRINLLGRYPASDLFRVDVDAPIVLGRISIAADDISFVAVEEDPNPDVERAFLPLLDLMRADTALIADLASPALAGALYSVLENEEFVAATGAVFEFGQRSAARFVAVLRNSGEDYLDFAWGRGPAFSPSDAERVRAHLVRLNITPREIE
jgi:hypothetical protein